MDKLLFIEIILSEGALFIDYVHEDGKTIEYYLAPNGSRKVMIFSDDEMLTKSQARHLLKQLGMHSTLERMSSML